MQGAEEDIFSLMLWFTKLMKRSVVREAVYSVYLMYILSRNIYTNRFYLPSSHSTYCVSFPTQKCQQVQEFYKYFLI